jgi:hypothetical protein
MMTELSDRSIQEVIELHAFFQGWLRGELPASDAVFSRFTNATAPEFMLISPTGAAAGYAETSGWIRNAHGTRPGVLLWTDNHLIRYADERIALVTYHEHQTLAGATTLRISSALFRRADAAPLGVAWLHVHETWK